MDHVSSFCTTEMMLAEQCTLAIMSTLKWTSRCAPFRTIVDATAGVGGNTINFAKYFGQVHAIEIDEQRKHFLQHNVNLLCGQIHKHKVTVHLGDAIQVLKHIEHQDLVFLDPPWGGEDYASKPLVDLHLSGRPLVDVCHDLQGVTDYICLKVPNNFNFDGFERSAKCYGNMRFLDKVAIGRKHKCCYCSEGKHTEEDPSPKFFLLMYQIYPTSSSLQSSSSHASCITH